jgi:4a-hydroxytetrahydrobiopterin dehydratase
MPKLTARQIELGLKALPEWSRRGQVIRRRFEFTGFLGSIKFVNRVAAKAEKADHHPDIDIRWNKVTLALSTHTEGGLTAKDFSMARQCDLIFSRLAGK